MNSANTRANRATKAPVLADRIARDLKNLAPTDDRLLHRWERIAQEIRA